MLSHPQYIRGIPWYKMEAFAAFFLLSAAVFSADVPPSCRNSVMCPCGRGEKNVTICLEESFTDNPCSRWEGCKSCQDGLTECVECLDGWEGPFCSKVKRSRKKRQYRFSQSNRRRANQGYIPYGTGRYDGGSGGCRDIDSPKLGSIECSTSGGQTICTGTCLPGYSFENRESETQIQLRCQNGVWTPMRSFPTCISGGHCTLEVVGHGSFNCTTSMQGTRCDVRCAHRYAGQYACYPGQSWGPPLPQCVRPKGGSVPTELRQTCRCQYGGSCNRNGNCVCPVGRTGTFCESVVAERPSCSDPGFIPNGNRRNMDGSQSTTRRRFQSGESVVFGCNADADALQGSAFLACNEGRWSGPLPKCIQPAATPEVTCADPGQVANADRVNTNGSPSLGVQQYSVGQSVAYECRPGFALQRRSLITCQGTGSWSNSLPFCTPTTPPTPATASTITVNPNRFAISCQDPGVDPKGDRMPPSTPDRRGFPPGSRLEFSCGPNHDLEGETKLFCLLSGRWSGEIPSCREQSRAVVGDDYCLNPGSLQNGKVMYYPDINSRRGSEDDLEAPEYPTGSRLQYSCERGYTLIGATSLVCRDNGDWSANPPTCRNAGNNYCLNPGKLQNGWAVYFPDINSRRGSEDDPESPEYPTGSRLRYSCDRGYTLIGAPSLVCRNTGDWSANPPTCRSAGNDYCPNPGSLQNGRVVYHLDISSRRGSAEDDLEPPEYPTGARLQYSCDRGYTLIGSVTLVCRDTGDWSASPPRCRSVSRTGDMVYCRNPGILVNGQVLYLPQLSERRRLQSSDADDPEYPVGARLQYSCNSGYTLDGPAMLTCQTTGQWSENPPYCSSSISSRELMYCDNPDGILDGRFTPILPDGSAGSVSSEDNILEYPEGTRLQYTCEEGYSLIGSSTLTCQSSGRWSSEYPICSTECGIPFKKISRRIINGEKTIAGQWPWVVAIAVRENNNSRIICGGAVINSRTVVTAAHCMVADPLTLYFGKLHRYDQEDDPKVITRQSTRMIRHPDFNDATLDSDIGLIMFSPTIRFTNQVQPICLPSFESTARNLMTGKKGYVTGWGLTEHSLPADQLLLAQLEYLTNNDCMEAYKKQSLNLPISSNMFCAGLKDGRQSTCTGDSGSPLVFNEQSTGDRYTLEGLVSFGVEGQCGLPERYTVFTKVSQFAPWILRNLL